MTTYMTPELEIRLDAVGAHAAPQWLEAAARALDELIAAGKPFAASDVWAALGDDAPVTHEPRALGPLVQRASRDGRIVQIGSRKSERRSGGLEAIWSAPGAVPSAPDPEQWAEPEPPEDTTDHLRVERDGHVLHLWSRWVGGRVVWVGRWGARTWTHNQLDHVLRSWKRATLTNETEEPTP